MSVKKIVSFIVSSVIVLFGLFCVFSGISSGDYPTSPLEIPAWSSRLVQNRLSQNDKLTKIAPSLLLAFGPKERDGIFITDDYLLENISSPNEEILKQNIEGIKKFTEKRNAHTAVVLIPTACAIKQRELPPSVRLFNQKELINQCYNQFSGLASTVDAYSQLFAAENQYTYYRTESLPTGLGGYYIYTALASRLGMNPRSLDQFEMQNLPQDYYGSLYARTNYKGVAPDLLTLYRFSRYSRQYKLSITENGELKSYYTLFPTHLGELGDPKSIIFGGFGERTDISVASPYEDSILIFADETALSYLPFLVVHHGNITIIDLASCTPEQLKEINVENYTRVLFSYSVDNFIHRDVCSAAAKI